MPKAENSCIGSLTIGLFWINPEKFLPADHKTTACGKAEGITTEPEDHQSYRQWLKEMTDRVGSNYPEVSHEAHLFVTPKQSQLGIRDASVPGSELDKITAEYLEEILRQASQ